MLKLTRSGSGSQRRLVTVLVKRQGPEAEVKLSGRKVFPHVLFWSAMGAIMALGWYVHDAAVSARASAQWAVQPAEVLRVLANVDAALSQADRAQREYLASPSERFLTERDQAYAALNASIARTGALVSDYPEQSE